MNQSARKINLSSEYLNQRIKILKSFVLILIKKINDKNEETENMIKYYEKNQRSI